MTNWTKLAVSSIKNVFDAIDPALGTEKAGKIIGINPKGDKTYQIDKIAEKAYFTNLPEDVTIVSEESGDMSGLDTFDYSFLFGAGANFKLLNKDFFFGYRMTVGWNTLAMPNAAGADPVPLRNQDYIFSLGMFF